MEEGLRRKLLELEKNEISEHFIYHKLARIVRDSRNREILERISADELKHYKFFQALTNKDVSPDKFKIFLYFILARCLGLTFSLKLMERGEDLALEVYSRLKETLPQAEDLLQDEGRHENELLNLLNEKRLKYTSSIVLGLNDALVELTGVLAGLTLALQNAGLIAVVGLITGISASLSMSASEYLSTKEERGDRNAFRASFYTGMTYLLTVLFLIFPYLLFQNVFLSLGFVLANALLIILLFTFYISTARGLSFKKRFVEMVLLSLSIAAVNFFIGLFIKRIFGIEA